jgi:hypothetical protein
MGEWDLMYVVEAPNNQLMQQRIRDPLSSTRVFRILLALRQTGSR